MRKLGKKIDVLEIKHGAYRHQVELRLDKDTNKFNAKLGDDFFVEEKLDDLKKRLQAKAAEMAEYEFRWYIDIRLGFSNGRGHGRSFSSRGAEFDELNPDEICSLDFSFDVFERSQVIETPGSDLQPFRRRMERRLEEVDGKLVPEGHGRDEVKHESVTVYDHDERITIEYTPERYAKLKQVRAGLYELARRLHEVIGSSERATASLDKAPTQWLLKGREA